jgi:hypothetical protein
MQPILNQVQQDELLKYDIQLMLDNFSLASLLAELLIKHADAKLPSPSATMRMKGITPLLNAEIPGENCGFFVTPVMHMAILDCRRSLEFFGLKCDDKTSRLKQIESRRADDLGIENFGLSQINRKTFYELQQRRQLAKLNPCWLKFIGSVTSSSLISLFYKIKLCCLQFVKFLQ